MQSPQLSPANLQESIIFFPPMNLIAQKCILILLCYDWTILQLCLQDLSIQ